MTDQPIWSRCDLCQRMVERSYVTSGVCATCEASRSRRSKGWDPGFYADGSFGWDHVRDRLAYLLGAYVSDVAPGVYRNRGDEIVWLQSELDKEPSDDAREEDDALDLLNEAAEECGAEERWYFDGYAGGLMYGRDEESEEP